MFHVFQHLVQIRAQQDRHFPKMDLHHCNSIQSEQHNIRHEFLLLQKFRNRMLTMHIAQILVRFGGFFQQATGALRYFPENALHEYHKEVSNNMAMYTSTSCSRSPAPCSQYHICTSTDQAPCAAAASSLGPGGRKTPKNARCGQRHPTSVNSKLLNSGILRSAQISYRIARMFGFSA